MCKSVLFLLMSYFVFQHAGMNQDKLEDRDDLALIEIRSPMPHEIESISQVYYKSWHHTFRNFPPELVAEKTPEKCLEIWNELCEIPRPVVFLIALKQDRVVGVAFAGPKTRCKDWAPYDCEIDKLYVLPECLGQGIGSALWKATINQLYKLGFKKVIFHSVSANAQANRFYERKGARLIEQLDVECGTMRIEIGMNIYEFCLAL